MFVLKNWAVFSDSNPYTPPECHKIYLKGNVYNHPEFNNGSFIQTSTVTKVKGNVIYTKSGSIYRLENPDAEYLDWCKKTKQHIPTEDEPIKILDNS